MSVTWAPGLSVLGSKFVLWTGGTLGSGLLRKVPQPVQSLIRTILPLSWMPLAQLLTEDMTELVTWSCAAVAKVDRSHDRLLTQAPAAPGTADF